MSSTRMPSVAVGLLDTKFLFRDGFVIERHYRHSLPRDSVFRSSNQVEKQFLLRSSNQIPRPSAGQLVVRCIKPLICVDEQFADFRYDAWTFRRKRLLRRWHWRHSILEQINYLWETNVSPPLAQLCQIQQRHGNINVASFSVGTSDA